MPAPLESALADRGVMNSRAARVRMQRTSSPRSFKRRNEIERLVRCNAAANDQHKRVSCRRENAPWPRVVSWVVAVRRRGLMPGSTDWLRGRPRRPG